MEIRKFWSRIGYHLPGTVQFDKKKRLNKDRNFSHLVYNRVAKCS